MDYLQHNKTLADKFKAGFYYITSKSDKLSGDKWQDLHSYFELGWEVGASQFSAKRLIADGIFRPDSDCIVTLAGREFLYSKHVTVITWEDFSMKRGIIDAKRTIDFGDVVDLTYQYASTARFEKWLFHPFYRYADAVKHLISDLDTPDVSEKAKEPFFVCGWRYRHNHVSTRNTPPETARIIHETLLKRAGKVYVVGHETETFCIPGRIEKVTLQEFSALCQHPNCIASVGAMTGTMQLAAIICRSKVAIIQHNPKQPENETNHPVVFGECVNLFHNQRMMRYEPECPASEFAKELEAFI